MWTILSYILVLFAIPAIVIWSANEEHKYKNKK